ncbi:MAG TPA: DUF2934 domain-containing protein [Terracidiphilus sp.]|nr:DUF2934 domain-containing protein [Terracidiphilus sp.]
MIVSKVQKQTKVKTSPASKSAAPELSATNDRIRERAFQIYEGRGSEPGHDTQDWLRAELQILER